MSKTSKRKSTWKKKKQSKKNIEIYNYIIPSLDHDKLAKRETKKKRYINIV